jgi:hypothetical protein
MSFIKLIKLFFSSSVVAKSTRIRGGYSNGARDYGSPNEWYKG